MLKKQFSFQFKHQFPLQPLKLGDKWPGKCLDGDIIGNASAVNLDLNITDGNSERRGLRREKKRQ